MILISLYNFLPNIVIGKIIFFLKYCTKMLTVFYITIECVKCVLNANSFVFFN